MNVPANHPPRKTALIEVLARHLPPSAAALRLLDIGGETSAVLGALRPDIQAQVASYTLADWSAVPASLDAVTAYDLPLDAALLARVLVALRPGGRLVLVQPAGQVAEAPVRLLEQLGYTRILAEAALPTGGLLLRGEKPHTAEGTLARVQIAADQDANQLDLTLYRGRFVHVLIQQTPNKPIWRLLPDEVIQWQAVAVGDPPALLAFSSLPKAVSFMQQAVLQDRIRDINKVAKFSKTTALTWTLPVILNPLLAQIEAGSLMRVPVDPAAAEQSDE